MDDSLWPGGLPASVRDAPDKGGRVRRMFNSIAPRYELVNALFSAGRDRVWRRRAVELADVGPGDDVLDIACGTGDFSRAFARANPRLVVGCDFAHQMLIRADGCDGIASRWCEADATCLPFRTQSFSIAACAFGVRNFEDLDLGLAEMFRVLRPRGRVVILEFSRPTNRLARRVYELYSNHLMPVAASLVSGDRSGAYRYLPRSVVSFPGGKQVCDKLRQAGFVRCRTTPLTMGIVTVFVAHRE